MSTSTSTHILKGNLKEFPLANLVRFLADHERSGLLEIEDLGNISFSHGEICLVECFSGDGIVETLERAGYMTSGPRPPAANSVSDSLDVRVNTIDLKDNEPGINLDTVMNPTLLASLLSLYPRSELALRKLVLEFSLNNLFELLVPNEADFSFDANAVTTFGSDFSQDARNLLTQAERRLKLWQEIAKSVPSTATVFELDPDLADDWDAPELDAQSWRCISRLDGRTTVADLVKATQQSAFEVCSRLHALASSGIIRQANSSPTQTIRLAPFDDTHQFAH